MVPESEIPGSSRLSWLSWLSCGIGVLLSLCCAGLALPVRQWASPPAWGRMRKACCRRPCPGCRPRPMHRLRPRCSRRSGMHVAASSAAPWHGRSSCACIRVRPPVGIAVRARAMSSTISLHSSVAVRTDPAICSGRRCRKRRKRTNTNSVRLAFAALRCGIAMSEGGAVSL